jgi:hypothetical protein
MSKTYFGRSRLSRGSRNQLKVLEKGSTDGCTHGGRGLARDRVPRGQTSTSRFLVNRRQFQVKAIRLAQALRCPVVYSRGDYALEYVRSSGRW